MATESKINGEQELLLLLGQTPLEDPQFERVTVRRAVDAGTKKIPITHVGYETTQQGANVDLRALLDINKFHSNDHQFGEVYIETEAGSIYCLQSCSIDRVNDQNKEHWEMADSKDPYNALILLKTGTVEVGKKFDADFRAPDGERHISTSPVKQITVLSTAMIGGTGSRDTDAVQRFEQAKATSPRK